MNFWNQPEMGRQGKNGFIALGPKWQETAGQLMPPRATSAAESALGLRPRRALSSAQPRPQWTTTTSPSNDSSSNGDQHLNLVSHDRGSLHGCVRCGADFQPDMEKEKLWATLPFIDESLSDSN
jgi:hypothetical protein